MSVIKSKPRPKPHNPKPAQGCCFLCERLAEIFLRFVLHCKDGIVHRTESSALYFYDSVLYTNCIDLGILPSVLYFCILTMQNTELYTIPPVLYFYIPHVINLCGTARPRCCLLPRLAPCPCSLAQDEARAVSTACRGRGRLAPFDCHHAAPVVISDQDGRHRHQQLL